MPELQRLFTAEEISFKDGTAGGWKLTVIDGWNFATQIKYIGGEESLVGVHQVVAFRRAPVTNSPIVHPLHGSLYETAQEAAQAAFEGHVLAFYEPQTKPSTELDLFLKSVLDQ
jgi:hypothetical protein